MTRSGWTGWRAIIAPTDEGDDTYGILWVNAPAMGRRGGYSGPFHDRLDAEDCVARWRSSWNMSVKDITIEHADEMPDLEFVEDVGYVSP